ncbi:uncharacterized protein LOC135371401 [Ornithodoros turicata]|uniref:uncharacterized protein LOC135371401 n=1 Tax=Ornithodoros turicata TaxID=34597 RepID=UPI003138F371
MVELTFIASTTGDPRRSTFTTCAAISPAVNAMACTGDHLAPPAATLAAHPAAPPAIFGLRLQLWFAHVAVLFADRHITSQLSEFGYILAHLPPETAAEVRDLIIRPHAEHLYDTLRDELIRRTTLSSENRIRQLLTSEELGDRRPTQLLCRMRELAGNPTAEDALLRELFLQRLPHNIRMILASSEHVSLDDQAKMADRIMELAGNPVLGTVANLSPTTAAPSPDPTIAMLTASLHQLRSTVAVLAERVAAIQPR